MGHVHKDTDRWHVGEVPFIELSRRPQQIFRNPRALVGHDTRHHGLHPKMRRLELVELLADPVADAHAIGELRLVQEALDEKPCSRNGRERIRGQARCTFVEIFEVGQRFCKPQQNLCVFPLRKRLISPHHLHGVGVLRSAPDSPQYPLRRHEHVALRCKRLDGIQSGRSRLVRYRREREPLSQALLAARRHAPLYQKIRHGINAETPGCAQVHHDSRLIPGKPDGDEVDRAVLGLVA